LNIVGDIIGLVAVWMVCESHEYECNNDTTTPPVGNNNQKGLPQTGIESSMLLWSAILVLVILIGINAGLKIRNKQFDKKEGE